MAEGTRKRRWFRFSLRTLIVFVVLLSLPLGWVASKVKQGRNQAEAVKAIVEAGGVVGYDYECDEDGEWIKDAEPPTPAWLRKLLGDDFLVDVVVVDFSHTEITDADLENVATLKQLKQLYLSDTQITDAGLEHLKVLSNLEFLSLKSSYRMFETDFAFGVIHMQISDDGIKNLQEALPNCRILR